MHGFNTVPEACQGSHTLFRVSWYPAPANLPSEYLQWACGHCADLQLNLSKQRLKLAQHISQQQ